MINAPTRPEDRIDAIDIIRGFVLFGVLIVNVLGALAGPHVANPGRADMVLQSLIETFFDNRSMPTFSLLFGLGLAMQCDRAKGSGFVPFLFRRQVALLFLGALHVALLWNGDILMDYALIGLVLMPFLWTSRKVLAVGSVSLLVLFSLAFAKIIKLPSVFSLHYLFGVLDPGNTMTSAYAHGTWMQAASLRIHEWAATYGGYLPWGFQIMAFFLAGVLVWRSGVFQSPTIHRRAIRTVMHGTFWLGLALSLASAILDVLFEARLLPAPGPALLAMFWVIYFAAVPLLVIGYVFGILHLTQQPRGRKALGFLAPIGRMALTNYLMQSAVAVTVFCGWGFGRWGLWHTWQITIYAVVLFAFQAVFSRWWLGRFRFGPVEWLWRSMTYGRLQPMKKRQIGAEAAATA